MLARTRLHTLGRLRSTRNRRLNRRFAASASKRIEARLQTPRTLARMSALQQAAMLCARQLAIAHRSALMLRRRRITANLLASMTLTRELAAAFALALPRSRSRLFALDATRKRLAPTKHVPLQIAFGTLGIVTLLAARVSTRQKTLTFSTARRNRIRTILPPLIDHFPPTSASSPLHSLTRRALALVTALLTAMLRARQKPIANRLA